MRGLFATMLTLASQLIWAQSAPCAGDSCCLEGTIWNSELGGCIADDSVPNWQPDFDNDQHIGVSDLLMFLSVFGDSDDDNDGIFDSVDDCVGYYDVLGDCNGTCSVDADSDGICDDIDDCVGTYDECGVCNGDGIPDGECDCFGNVFDECGFCGGSGPNALGDCCGDSFYYEGYHYPTVKIGEQCWFQENLRYLPAVSPDNIGSETEPHYYVLNYSGNDVDEAKSTAEYQERGVLYNKLAASQSCPTGRGMPTYQEWIELISGFGEEISTDNCAVCDQAFSNGAAFQATASNESGFSSIQSGMVIYSITYGGGYQSIASSTRYFSTDGATVKMSSSLVEIFNWSGVDSDNGYPLRCIQD